MDRDSTKIYGNDFSAHGCAAFPADSNWEKRLAGFDQNNFHRGCTGIAEKQLRVFDQSSMTGSSLATCDRSQVESTISIISRSSFLVEL